MDAPRPLLQPAPFSSLSARRICLIKPSALGDVVQALPILAAVRRRFPAAKISWVVNSAYAPLLRPIRQLDEVIAFDRGMGRRGLWQGALSFARFLGSLRDRQFDLVIDLQGLLRTGLMTWRSGAAHRLGLASAREGAHLAYTYLVNDLPILQPAVTRYWQVAAALGVGHAPIEYPLDLSSTEQGWAAEQLAALPRPWLLLCPGSQWQTKRWPAPKFAQAANKVVAPVGGSAIILGGPGEEEVAAECAKHLRLPYRNLCGRTDLRQLAALCRAGDVLLTNDSGPMHLAAAVGTPTVSLFTCTAPERAAPLGDDHRVVQTTVPCRASYIRQCSSMACMEQLTTAVVVPTLTEAVDESLARSSVIAGGCGSRRLHAVG